LSRLASIEAQQRVQTQMLQSILQSAAKRDNLETCELPDDVVLSLETLGDLQSLEGKLNDDVEMKTLMASFNNMTVVHFSSHLSFLAAQRSKHQLLS